MYPRITVTERCASRLRAGHLWVFNNDVASAQAHANGAVVSIISMRGEFLGNGYFNEKSKITARILSRDEEEIGPDFFLNRFKRALAHRESLGYDRTGSFRVVFSESDGLPGLIVDKYGNSAVMQISTLGMEAFREEIKWSIGEILKPETLVERSDTESRAKEGLGVVKGLAWGTGRGSTRIELAGLKFRVEMLDGQKTGFYLDQQDNRELVSGYARGRKVLDCFSYTGAFAIHALKAGAVLVTAVESSRPAADILAENLRLNGMTKGARIVHADVFDFLRDEFKAGAKYGLVMLDPPPFAKDRGGVKGALRGYNELALSSLKLLEPGGILAVSSCSQLVGLDALANTLKYSAMDAKCEMLLLGAGMQGRDHPVRLPMLETRYLSSVILKKQ
jgi:23S rRNA (cytosine1962-C5)-methyltransferase